MYPYDFNNSFGNFNNFNPYAMGNFGQNNNNYGQQMQQQTQQAGGLDIVTVQNVGQVEQVQINPGQRRLVMVQNWNEKHEHYIEKHARIKCMIDTYAKA